mmetsp:Transcript_7910/g.23809  ORF Transcript_7910/g.23809 Transcript_7910/m.23809 type:complete len:839 (+) Transcript_7910:1217-3733(+)
MRTESGCGRSGSRRGRWRCRDRRSRQAGSTVAVGEAAAVIAVVVASIRKGTAERARAVVVKLPRLLELHHALLEVVERALHEAVVPLEVAEQVVPQDLLRQDLGISQHDQAVPRTRERYVETARVAEETDALALIASDAREDDVIFLTTLECIDGCNLDLCIELLAKSAVALHIAHDVGALALVRRDDANLSRRGAALEKSSNDLLDIAGLRAVEVRGAGSRELLGAKRYVEHERLRGNRPREVHAHGLALGVRHAILKRTLVEGVGRELRKHRVHAVLNLQAHGLDPQHHHALEERLGQAGLGRLLAQHHGAQLAVVAHKHQLLGTHNNGDETLGLRRLSALVHKNLLKPEVVEPWVACAHARGADDVGRHQQLALRRALELLVLLLVGGAQLALLGLELQQLAELELVRRVQLLDLMVEGEVLDRGAHRLAALGAHADHLEARAVDLLREMVHGHVAGRRHEHLPLAHLGQVVDDAGRRHRLARPGRTLDDAERLLQHALDRENLRVVELRKPGRREALGQRAPHNLRLHVVAQQSVVEIPAYGGLVHGEVAHRRLHAVEGRGLPHELDAEAVGAVHGRARPVADLEGHLLAVGLLDDAADAAPLAHPVAEVELELVPGHQPHLALVLGEHEVGDTLLVEPHVPVHHQVLLAVLLLHHLVVVRLVLDQGTENVLVLIGVLVGQQHRGRLVVDPRLVQVLQLGVGLGLPEVFDLDELRGRQQARARLLVLGGDLDEPGEEALVAVDEGQPQRQVPVHVLHAPRLHARPAQQHHHLLLLCGDKSQHKDVALATVVALEDCFPKWGIPMKRNFFALGPDKVVDNTATSKLIAIAVAKPL